MNHFQGNVGCFEGFHGNRVDAGGVEKKGISRTRMIYEFNVSMANMVHSS